MVALSLAVFDHTHSALAVAALLFAGQALPAFVVPALVARVEASKRKSELSNLYFFEAVVTAALAVLLWHFWLPAILLLAALDGTAALAASALLRAEVARAARDTIEPEPQGTTEEESEPASSEAERKANAALNVAFSMTFVLGPALAGALVAAAGAPAALFIDVGSFLICGVMLIDLHPRVEEAGDDSVAARLRAAWKHINETPSMRRLLMAEFVALLFFETGGPIEVAYAKVSLHAGDRGYGLLLTSWGVGAVLGSLVFARLVSRPLAIMLSAGTLAIGFGYVGFGVAPSLLLGCMAAVVGGIGNGLQWPSMISIVQRLTPQALQGRLMGALESLGALSLAIGLPLGGALVALSTPRIAFLTVGLGAIAATGALFVVSPSSIRRGSAAPPRPQPEEGLGEAPRQQPVGK